MERIIDSLPGVTLSVDKVTETLTHMWDTGWNAEGSPLDFRASQGNLILHMGLKTTGEEARRLFDKAITFAQTYPCRIIVLCPAEEGRADSVFEGKLFSQCYLGKHLRDLCCCEALILGYRPEESDFLENQISIWLESDLPIYHWFHRVPEHRIADHYMHFLQRCRRIIYDGSIDGTRYDNLPWPDRSRVRDLVWARSLPLRQHIGQFLSGFDPVLLSNGLEKVTIRVVPELVRLAGHLSCWHEAALAKCLGSNLQASQIPFIVESNEECAEASCLEVEWTYSKSASALRWHYNRVAGSGCIEASFKGQHIEHPLHIESMAEETVLAEALFFA
jgi:hypothetical protein